jgi:hypothetical protein
MTSGISGTDGANEPGLSALELLRDDVLSRWQPLAQAMMSPHRWHYGGRKGPNLSVGSMTDRSMTEIVNRGDQAVSIALEVKNINGTAAG